MLSKTPIASFAGVPQSDEGGGGAGEEGAPSVLAGARQALMTP